MIAEYFERNHNQPQLINFLELVNGTKNLSLIIEIKQEGNHSLALYRPEMGVRLTLDPRIPKPYELYHDCAYTALSAILGWNITAPAVPFMIDENDYGVIRPFFPEASNKPHYFFETIEENDYWLKVAITDYLAGVVDRTSNDFLFLTNGDIKVIDSGLSFVEGTGFSAQISIIRKRFKGHSISPHLLADICKLNEIDLINLIPFLHNGQEAVKWIIDRQKALLEQKEIQ